MRKPVNCSGPASSPYSAERLIHLPRSEATPLAHREAAKEAFMRALKAEIRANGRITSGPMAGRQLMILTTTGARTANPGRPSSTSVGTASIT
jgi:hypothetical protein